MRPTIRSGGAESGGLGPEARPLQKWPEVPCTYIVYAERRTVSPPRARCAAREGT